MNPQSGVNSTVAPWPGQDDGDEGRRQRGLTVAATTVETQAVRVTYRQDWSAYNAARVGDGYPFLRTILDRIGDRELLAALQPPYITGRPPYPARALWRAYVVSFVLNLAHTNALIRRLGDETILRELCGFGDDLPHRTTFNRFIQRLSHHAGLVETALVGVTNHLKEWLPGLGDEVAIDSTAVRTHSNPNRKTISDPEAKWGVKNSAKAKEGGTEYFFGFKVHMVADATYGIPLAQVVTAGNRNDSPVLPDVMKQAEAMYDWWKPRVAIADRGYDSSANHNWLDARGVIPVIHIRQTSHTKDKLHDGIYTKEGVPTCLGGIPMEFVETDPATGHHHYICQEGGCHLKGKKGGVIYCDSEVWENPSNNIRLFGKIRRDSPEWKDYYRKRQAIERVFKSLKESRRLERHCIRGLRRVTLHSLMSTLAFQATALVRILMGEAEHMRWMVRQVA